MATMNKEREWLLREKYHGIESPEFFADLTRVENGEPIDYIIGFSTFLGCHIDLSKKPLIPRTETEYWVEKALSEIATDKPIKILDVFSGSGCIGIAALSHLPNAQVDFADIDENTIEQIKINLKKNTIDSSRCAVYKSDVFDGLTEGKTYDVIFANPPYIGTKHRERVQDSVFDHEPYTALFSGDDGMPLIKKTLVSLKDRLAPNGTFYLEFDDIQQGMLKMLLTDLNFTDFSLHKDQFGLVRMAKILRS